MADLTLDLLRSERIPDGVFGILRLGDLELHTCEEDWNANQRRISCIPDGTYTLQRTLYIRHNYPTYEVMDVPGRSRILIHPGNTEEDVEGCILVGMRRGFREKKDEDTGALHRKHAVLESRIAFDKFMAAMDGANHATLTIRWAPGLP